MADTTDVLGVLEKSAENENAGKPANERRRRLRTKVSAPVRVRVNSGSAQQAEVCTTVDASRDGLLFTTAYSGYQPGMDLAITFPYSGSAGGMQHERTAAVARVFEMPEGRYGIGIRFHDAKRAGANLGETNLTETIRVKTPRTTRSAEKPMPLLLVVESDARMRDALRTVLHNDGYTVEAVATGAEAVDFLRHRTPNLLLTEIEIEDMSGYDLCLIVKSNDRLREVPVVMTTRRGQPNDYSTAHALGAIVCIAKPYKQERLMHVIHMLAPSTENEEHVSAPKPRTSNARANGFSRAQGNGGSGHARARH